MQITVFSDDSLSELFCVGFRLPMASSEPKYQMVSSDSTIQDNGKHRKKHLLIPQNPLIRKMKISRGFGLDNHVSNRTISGIDLNLNGKLTENWLIQAKVHDDGMTASAQGISTPISSIEEMMLSVTNQKTSLEIGSIKAQQELAAVGEIRYSGKGVKSSHNGEFLDFNISWIAPDGIAKTQRIQVQKNLQGPYFLTGRKNEKPIQVISVIANHGGIQLEQNRDFWITSSSITFSEEIASKGEEVIVQFEYLSPYSHDRTQIGATAKTKFGDFSISDVREWQSSKIQWGLESQHLQGVRSVADGNYIELTDSTTGQSYFQFANDGDLDVEFVFVGVGNGSYQKLSEKEFEFVGLKQGDYNPGFSAVNSDPKALSAFQYSFRRENREILLSTIATSQNAILGKWNEKHGDEKFSWNVHSEFGYVGSKFSAFNPDANIRILDRYLIRSGDNPKLQWLKIGLGAKNNKFYNFVCEPLFLQIGNGKANGINASAEIGNLKHFYIRAKQEYLEKSMLNSEKKNTTAEVGAIAGGLRMIAGWEDRALHDYLENQNPPRNTGYFSRLNWKNAEIEMRREHRIDSKSDTFWRSIRISTQSKKRWFHTISTRFLMDEEVGKWVPNLSLDLTSPPKISHTKFRYSVDFSKKIQYRSRWMFVEVPQGTGNYEYDFDLQEHVKSEFGDFIRQILIEPTDEAANSLEQHLHFTKRFRFPQDILLKWRLEWDAAADITDSLFSWQNVFLPENQNTNRSLWNGRTGFLLKKGKNSINIDYKYNFNRNHNLYQGNSSSEFQQLRAGGRLKFEDSSWLLFGENSQKNILSPLGLWNNRAVESNRIKLDWKQNRMLNTNSTMEFQIDNGKFDRTQYVARMLAISGSVIFSSKVIYLNNSVQFSQVFTENETILLPPEMVDGNQTGRNFCWKINLQWQITEQISLEANYRGRHDERRGLKHQAMILMVTEI